MYCVRKAWRMADALGPFPRALYESSFTRVFPPALNTQNLRPPLSTADSGSGTTRILRETLSVSGESKLRSAFRPIRPIASPALAHAPASPRSDPSRRDESNRVRPTFSAHKQAHEFASGLQSLPSERIERPRVGGLRGKCERSEE